jgi:metal-responsive CopG/Arc/MetJ family transcriptional regulator
MKVSEVRTQIYFPQKLYNQLKTHARQQNASLAEIVRKAAQAFLEAEATNAFWQSGKAQKAVGMVKIGKRSSRSIDDIVYGRKK